MQKDFGTLDWCDRTGGKLTPADRLVITLQGSAAIVQNLFDGVMPEPRALDVDLAPPETRFARLAERLLEETSPPWLVNHGRRTYAWAMAFAARGGVRPDRELLRCASLLHDLGLVAPFEPEVGACFAASGARGAEARLVEGGMDPSRARRVADAIALHLNVVVALDEHGPEAHLLRAATAYDVIGQSFRRIPRDVRERILAEIPRLDFKTGVVSSVARMAARSPASRIGFLCSRVGLLGRVKAAPFES